MKSHVTMEQHACVACLTPYDTDAILLDRRLRQIFENKTVTAVAGLCSECSQKRKDGFIALIGAKPQPEIDWVTKPEQVERTGDLIHMQEHVFKQIFNAPVPEQRIAFVDPEVIEKIKQIMENCNAEE